MSIATRLSIVGYFGTGLALVGQGLHYLLASQYMSYHAKVTAMPWSDLSGGEQTLMLGLLKGFGAGMFSVGLALVLLALVPLQTGLASVRWLTAFIALTYTGALVYATRFALLPGAGPIRVMETLFAVSLASAVASFVGAG